MFRTLSCLCLPVCLVLPLAQPLAAATITVDQPADLDADDAACSLREAILAANANSSYHGCTGGTGPDRIVFALATPATITLAGPLPRIEESLLLRGPGATLLTLDGVDTWSLIEFDSASPNRWLGVTDLTLTRGLAAYGGGALVADGATAHFERVAFLNNQATGSGGGLTVQSGCSASLTECWFSGNLASGPAGGGGVYAAGGSVVVVNQTTFSGNLAGHANGTGGALVVNGGEAALARTTISGNTASSSGGGISLRGTGDGASLVLRDVTITNNETLEDGGGLKVGVITGEVVLLELGNSILAGNISPLAPDVAFSGIPTLTSLGFNLVGSNEGATVLPDGLPNGAGDWVGTDVAPLGAQLGALDFYGALIPTHRPNLVPLSPAIDAGSCPGATSDQRGFGNLASGQRVVDFGAIANGPGSDGCDIGAHERGGEDGVDRTIFANGFEEGHTLLWSTEVL